MTVQACAQEPASKAGKLKVKVLKSQSATLNTQDTAEPKNAETQAGGPSRKRQRDDSATEKVRLQNVYFVSDDYANSL